MISFCVYELGKWICIYFRSRNARNQSTCSEFEACLMHLPWALEVLAFSARALDLSHFTRKSKFALLTS